MVDISAIFSPKQSWQPFLQRSLRVLIIIAILGISAYIIPSASPLELLLGLGALLGMGAVIILLRLPALGLVAMLPACLVIPIEIGTGSGSSLHAGLLLLFLLTGLWVLTMVTRKHVAFMIHSRPVFALFCLLIVSLMAFAFGQLPWFPVAPAPLTAQIGGLFVFVLSICAFLLVAHQIRSLVWLHWMTWLYLGIASLYVLAQLVPQLGRFLVLLFQYGSTGSLFWVWLIALSFSQAFFNRHLPIGIRAALIGLVIATFYVAYVQGNDWKSGWVPPFATVAIIVAVRWWRLAAIGAVLGAGSMLGFAAKLIATDAYSFMTRIEAWLVLLDIISKNPILGVGPANYYWYTPLFPILGWRVQFNSHSQYIDLLLQTGLLGLFCFLWFAWSVGRLGWRLRNQAPAGFAHAYVYGALGGLGGTLVAAGLGDWVLPFVYNVGLAGMRASLPGWMFLGGLVALEQIVSRQNADKKQPARTVSKTVSKVVS